MIEVLSPSTLSKPFQPFAGSASLVDETVAQHNSVQAHPNYRSLVVYGHHWPLVGTEPDVGRCDHGMSETVTTGVGRENSIELEEWRQVRTSLLGKDSQLTPSQQGMLSECWDAVVSAAGAFCRAPSCYLVDEDGDDVLVLDWSCGRFWATIRIDENGRIGWMLRDPIRKVARSRLRWQELNKLPDEFTSMLAVVFLRGD